MIISHLYKVFAFRISKYFLNIKPRAPPGETLNGCRTLQISPLPGLKVVSSHPGEDKRES